MKAEDVSDALVFFGATGDLAHKMIFPALQALVRKGRLRVPIIGVASAGWNLEQLRARARDSLEKFGGGVDEPAFAKLSGLLRHVDGDYEAPGTFGGASSTRSSTTVCPCIPTPAGPGVPPGRGTLVAPPGGWHEPKGTVSTGAA
jgi:glucose-6-phosphate 1-dehydrogenase